MAQEETKIRQRQKHRKTLTNKHMRRQQREKKKIDDRSLGVRPRCVCPISFYSLNENPTLPYPCGQFASRRRPHAARPQLRPCAVSGAIAASGVGSALFGRAAVVAARATAQEEARAPNRYPYPASREQHHDDYHHHDDARAVHSRDGRRG